METEHAHSCVTEIGFENQSVSTTNLVGGYMKEQVGSRQRSLSLLSFFSCRERPLLAGKTKSCFVLRFLRFAGDNLKFAQKIKPNCGLHNDFTSPWKTLQYGKCCF